MEDDTMVDYIKTEADVWLIIFLNSTNPLKCIIWETCAGSLCSCEHTTPPVLEA